MADHALGRVYWSSHPALLGPVTSWPPRVRSWARSFRQSRSVHDHQIRGDRADQTIQMIDARIFGRLSAQRVILSEDVRHDRCRVQEYDGC